MGEVTGEYGGCCATYTSKQFYISIMKFKFRQHFKIDLLTWCFRAV